MTNNNATSANGKTASVHKTIDADPSDGLLGRTCVVTGPAGLIRTESSRATFGDGNPLAERVPSGAGILLANSKSSNFNGFQTEYPVGTTK